MKFKHRKSAQRKINKAVKNMNKSIAVDPLWRGRFCAHQTYSSWESFTDGSGGILNVNIEFKDKKTGYTKLFLFDSCGRIEWYLFLAMNDFIVTDCHDSTWGDREAILADTTDYTKIN